MKNKNSIIILFLMLISSAATNADGWELLFLQKESSSNVSASISVPDGKIIEFFNTKIREQETEVTMSVDFNGLFTDSVSEIASDGQKYIGPVEINFQIRSSYRYDFIGSFIYTRYRISNANLQTREGVPHSSVVIPEDESGLVNIYLESSVNLVDWTSANPGMYGSTDTSRYFRVRAVRVGE